MAELYEELGLTEGEYRDIVRLLGREPNKVELGMYSLMWSEHCSYKSSRTVLAQLPTRASYVLQGPGENAGVIDIGGGLAVAFKWFLEEARATAIGIVTVFFYLGSAVGIPLVTAIAGIPEDTTDLALMTSGVNRVLTVFAVVMAVSTVVFILLAREEPPTPSGPVPEEAKLGVTAALRRFLAAPTFQALALVSLIGYGAFVGLTVTMEKIIGYHGFSASFASFVASALIVGGIIGAGILPGLSEKIGLRKPFLILAAAVTVPMGFLIGFVAVKALNIAGAFLLGFFLLAALPVTFTIVSEMKEIGPVFAGSAVGTLMALGNIGSLIIPLGMEALKGGTAEFPDYRVSLIMLWALAVIGMLVVIWRVKETGPRARKDEPTG